MPEYRTPGVYIVEQDAFPNSVVGVPTTIPVFIGYTEKALTNGTSLHLVPTRITSFSGFEEAFGNGPQLVVQLDADDPGAMECRTPFLMHRGLKLFYENGGGDCYILSVGTYDAKKPDPQAYDAALSELIEVSEPSMVVTPDTAKMSPQDWGYVTRAVLEHCAHTKRSMAILDVVEGDLPITKQNGKRAFEEFYDGTGNVFLDHGAAYYPWLNTDLTERRSIGFSSFDPKMRKDFIKPAILRDEPELFAANEDNQKLLQDMVDAKDDAAQHSALMDISATYTQIVDSALEAVNVMPPACAMAGIYCRTDTDVGPWKAPANVAVNRTLSPVFNISDNEQHDLNNPLTGKSINAIRAFENRGVLVWGARTLDGSNGDWRYVSVKRTMIFIEQSAKMACEAYVFEPNSANTWQVVKSMLENFLTDLWRQGGLVGTRPEEAFSVKVGLGATMTELDILDGYLVVDIMVALVKPAEFIVLTLRQKMQ